MVKHTFKILQEKLQDFWRVFHHFVKVGGIELIFVLNSKEFIRKWLMHLNLCENICFVVSYFATPFTGDYDFQIFLTVLLNGDLALKWKYFKKSNQGTYQMHLQYAKIYLGPWKM